VVTLDILVLYSHNLENQSQGGLESIKRINRYSKYIHKHFGAGCVPYPVSQPILLYPHPSGVRSINGTGLAERMISCHRKKHDCRGGIQSQGRFRHNYSLLMTGG